MSMPFQQDRMTSKQEEGTEEDSKRELTFAAHVRVQEENAHAADARKEYSQGGSKCGDSRYDFS